MERRASLLLAAIGAGVLISCGVALAANLISYNGGLREGTTGDDEMIGTSDTDDIYVKEDNDILRDGRSFDRGLRGDDLYGGGGNDDLMDGNGGSSPPQAADLDDVFSGLGNGSIDVQDGGNDDIVCPGNDTVTKDSGDIVDEPAFGC